MVHECISTYEKVVIQFYFLVYNPEKDSYQMNLDDLNLNFASNSIKWYMQTKVIKSYPIHCIGKISSLRAE